MTIQSLTATKTTLVTIAVDAGATLDNAFDNMPSQSVSVTTRDVDGSIRGTVWDDIDGSQTQNGTEPGLGGVTVYLDLNRNGQLDGGEPTQLTAADGSYSFVNVEAGRIRRSPNPPHRTGSDLPASRRDSRDIRGGW